MRHTFATLALAATIPLEWISKQMRHTDIETTRRHYARWIRRAETHWLGILNSYAAAENGGTNRPQAAANPPG